MTSTYSNLSGDTMKKGIHIKCLRSSGYARLLDPTMLFTLHTYLLTCIHNYKKFFSGFGLE